MSFFNVLSVFNTASSAAPQIPLSGAGLEPSINAEKRTPVSGTYSFNSNMSHIYDRWPILLHDSNGTVQGRT